MDERSLRSAIHVFIEKLKMDKCFDEREEAVMDMIVAAAKQIEEKIGGKPDVMVIINAGPELCYQRISGRDQPDDKSIQLGELRCIDLLHKRMAREAIEEGITVVYLDEVEQDQKVLQLRELSAYLESIAAGEEDVGKPVFITILKPKVN